MKNQYFDNAIAAVKAGDEKAYREAMQFMARQTMLTVDQAAEDVIDAYAPAKWYKRLPLVRHVRYLAMLAKVEYSHWKMVRAGRLDPLEMRIDRELLRAVYSGRV